MYTDFNRPKQLQDLLNSLDCDQNKVEIAICEDKAPKRMEVRETVKDFQKNSKYTIEYRENDQIGFDGNVI